MQMAHYKLTIIIIINECNIFKVQQFNRSL